MPYATTVCITATTIGKKTLIITVSLQLSLAPVYLTPFSKSFYTAVDHDSNQYIIGNK